ncbi:MAG: MATE family efflux transporter [Lachnospira sp.]
MGRLTIATKFNTARLLQFVFPAVAMMIVTSIYVMTDGIFISQFAGSEQLSATNIVYPVVYLLNGIGVMLSMGGNAIVARLLGEGKGSLARQRFTQLAFFTVVSGVVLGILFCTDNASDFTGAWRKGRTAGYVLCAVWHNHGTLARRFPCYRCYSCRSGRRMISRSTD